MIRLGEMECHSLSSFPYNLLLFSPCLDHRYRPTIFRRQQISFSHPNISVLLESLDVPTVTQRLMEKLSIKIVPSLTEDSKPVPSDTEAKNSIPTVA